MRQLFTIISTGWDLMRWIRMGLGVMIMLDAIKRSDWFMGILALILISQALLNVGCCGVGGCAPSPFSSNKPKTQNETEDITYKEIK